MIDILNACATTLTPTWYQAEGPSDFRLCSASLLKFSQMQYTREPMVTKMLVMY